MRIKITSSITIFHKINILFYGGKGARLMLAAKPRPHVARQAEVRHAAEAKKML